MAATGMLGPNDPIAPPPLLANPDAQPNAPLAPVPTPAAPEKPFVPVSPVPAVGVPKDKWGVDLLDPTTATVQRLDPAAAQEAWLSGKMLLPGGAKVVLAHPESGEVGEFDAGNVVGAMRNGYVFADQHAYLKAKAENQPVRALLEGSARSLTFGASDIAMSQFGVAGLAERADTAAGMAGQLGTDVVSALLPLGLAGKVTGVLAGHLAADAASLAVRSASSKALAHVAGSTVSNVLGHAAGDAAVGAGIGALQGLSEEMMGDPKANAEDLWSAMGGGALVGFGAGGVLGGVVGGASSLKKAVFRKSSPEELAATLAGNGVDADKGVLARWADRYDKLVSEDIPAAIGYKRSDLAKVRSPEARAYIAERGQIQDDMARAYGKHLERGLSDVELDQVAAASPDLVAKWTEGANPAHAVEQTRGALDALKQLFVQATDAEVAQGLGKGHVARAFKGPSQAIEQAIAELDAMTPKPPAAVAKKGRPSARRKAADVYGEGAQVVATPSADQIEWPSDTPAKLYEKLDALHEAVGRVRKSAEPEVRDLAQQSQDMVKAAFISGAFGETAGKKWLGLQNAYEQHAQQAQAVAQKFGLKAGPDGGWQVDTEAIARKVAGTRHTTELLSSADGLMASKDAVMRALDEFHGTDAFTAGLRKGKQDFDATIADYAKKLETFNALDDLRGQELAQHWGGVGQAAPYMAGAVGMSMGGVLGASAGAMLGGAARTVAQQVVAPASAAQTRARMQGVLASIRPHIASIAESFVDRTAAQLPATTRTVSSTTRAIIDATSESDRYDAYQQRQRELATLAIPGGFTTQFGKATRDLADALPTHTAELNQTSQTALMFLLQKAPTPKVGTELMTGPAPKPDPSTVLRYAQQDRAVQDPLGTLALAAKRGAVLPHELQALQEVHPGLLNRFQQQVIDKLTDRPTKPSHDAARLLQSLLGDIEPLRTFQMRQLVHAPPEPPPGPNPYRTGQPRSGHSNGAPMSDTLRPF